MSMSDKLPSPERGTPLLPCPMCGASEVRVKHSNSTGGSWRVKCYKCMSTGPFGKNVAVTKELWNRRALSTPPAEVRASVAIEVVREIAMDIGKETVAYLEVMYPEAAKAATSTFALSLRNHIYNEIMASINLHNPEAIRARLADRKAFRRNWLASWREIRRSTPFSRPKDEGAPLALSHSAQATKDRVSAPVAMTKDMELAAEKADRDFSNNCFHGLGHLSRFDFVYHFVLAAAAAGEQK